jgi:peptide/nickel transport system permease protein
MTFLLRRALFYLITLWAAITANFLLPRLLPGDPVQAMITKLGGRLNSDAMASLYILFGLDQKKSIWEQYVDYWGALARGDLGLSFTFFPTPVADVLSQSLPWTLGLIGVTTVIAFLLGTLLGVYAGWRRGSWLDNLIPVTTFLSSIPYFWLGLIAISVFSVTFPLLPASGGYAAGLVPEWSGEFVGSVLEHAVLPGITIVISSVAGWILGMRNMMVTVTAGTTCWSRGPRACRSGGSCSPTPRATRCCRRSPVSRCRWVSSSAAHCWSRWCSRIQDSGTSSSRASARRTTR